MYFAQKQQNLRIVILNNHAPTYMDYSIKICNFQKLYVETGLCRVSSTMTDERIICVFYTIPCANIASATLTKPAMFAPST